ncbi:hypothetical protein BDP67DRAFT_505199 [Colletotrichum lupini]|nr:hypothetical protein BDP67DRAFT_505199 [Colletotrichum lupini]
MLRYGLGGIGLRRRRRLLLLLLVVLRRMRLKMAAADGRNCALGSERRRSRRGCGLLPKCLCRCCLRWWCSLEYRCQ